MSIEQRTPSITLVLPLDASTATLESVGGKGASLARMAAAGLPVPPGFHVTTTAYRQFIAANHLQEAILAAVVTATPNNPASLETASSQIAQLFIQGAIPDDITTAIRQAYRQLGDGNLAVAVRSSATAEDLPGMSFAGQQETYLNMRGESSVLAAVKRCWASLWTARAIGYRARQGIAPDDVSLAVVVQQLVPADAAGILFTANPLTGARDQVMINAAWGLGEAIVSGQVTPDTLTVAKASGTIIAQEISEKQAMTIRTELGTQEQPVPASQRTVAVLRPAQVAELTRISVQIEHLYEQPMDIEWALHNNQFFIVQARPITALPTPPAPPALPSLPAVTTTQAGPETMSWNLPKPKGHYARSSVIELLPDPLTPLFATLGLPYWNKATHDLLNEINLGSIDSQLVTINDYCYYDVSFTAAQSMSLLLTLPRLIPAFAGAMRTARQRWEQEARPAYTQLARQWEAQDLTSTPAIELLKGAHALLDVAARYYLTIQGGILPAAYMSESLFTLVYDKLLKQHGDPAALTFFLGYDSTPIQAEKSLYDLAQWARAQTGLADTIAQLSADQFTAAYQEMQLTGMAETTWAELCQRLAAHLARFGHTIYDLDFAKKLPIEDPASQLETLKYFLSGTAPNPYTRQATSMQQREQAMRTLKGRLGKVRLSFFWRLLRPAQRFAPLREDALADVGLGWPVLRQMLYEIAHRLIAAHALAQPDDIFWLTAAEVQAGVQALDHAQTPHNYQAVVSARRSIWEQERKVTPPSSLPLKTPARFLGFDFRSMLPANTDQQEGNVIKGIGASPGHIEGVARVIHGPEEFDQMHAGDILVAKITTPAWTPLFALAAGIVTDVGGPLSHSSIVAREYHIPAVLGTGVATTRLHSGQRVTVDGDAGTVTLM